MKARRAKSQRGIALIATLAVIAIGASWFLVKQLYADSASLSAIRKDRNAETLNQAKQALIGYVVARAAMGEENNPGSLPCPEDPATFGTAATEGFAAATCAAPAVGRLPWKTLGLDKLTDSSGEPLWYAISPNWHVVAANLVINSNTAGQLNVDNVANDSVAVIIAPGPAINVPAGVGCTVQQQVRATAGAPNVLNYLECENATTADNKYSTTGPSPAFNDQLVRITANEILPPVEAAIANRFERQIAPTLKSMYSGGAWSGSSTSPRFPYPAAFSDPSTSAMLGNTALSAGLFPLSHAETTPLSGTLCTVGSDPRCNPTIVSWASANMTSTADTYNESCTTTASQITCTFYYRVCLVFLFCGSTTTANVVVNGTANNVGRVMRQLNPSTGAMTNMSTVGTLSAVLNSNSSATMALDGYATVSSSGTGLLSNLICGIGGLLGLVMGCKQSTISIPITVFADHSLLDSASVGPSAIGWFMRNKWHEVAYYAVATPNLPNGTPNCVNNTTCLAVAYHRTTAGVSDTGRQRAVLLFSGRSLTNVARPNGTLSDWFEGANADGTSPFEVRSSTSIPNRTFNDHVAVIDSN